MVAAMAIYRRDRGHWGLWNRYADGMSWAAIKCCVGQKQEPVMQSNRYRNAFIK